MPYRSQMLAQAAQIPRRRDDVAALALDRLDEDRGDIVGVEMPGEELLLDHVEAAAGARRLVGAPLAAVAVGKRDVVHVGQQRTEPGVLPRLAGGEAHRTGGAPVKRAAERDDRRAPGGVAGELDGASVASVPELVRNTRFFDGPGAIRASRSHSAAMPS